MLRWKFAALALCVLALVVATFWSARPRENPGASLLPGHVLYGEHCRRCHGPFGDGAKASRLARRRVDLTAPAFRDTTSLDDLKRIVRQGKGRMEGLGARLDSLQVDSLAVYVRRFPGRS